VAILLRHAAWKWLTVSIGIGVLAQLALLAGDAQATRLHVPLLGDAYRRTLGWQSLGEQAGQLARRVGARAIVGDQRDGVASLLYYWRDQPEPVLAWAAGTTAAHQFELTRGLSDMTPLPILFVSHCSNADRLAAQFAKVEALGTFNTPTGPSSARSYSAFKLDAPRGSIRPLGPCA